MSSHVFKIERELKNLLTHFGYVQLLKHFGLKLENIEPQVNNYFDTSEFDLSGQKVMLRARDKKRAWEITMKEFGEEGIKETTHRPLTDEERILLFNEGVIPAGNVYDAVRRFTANPVRHLGPLATDRAVVTVPCGEVMLDRSRYGNTVDFEIELKVAQPFTMDEAESFLSQLLEKYEIKRQTPQSKFQRFLKEKQKK